MKLTYAVQNLKHSNGTSSVFPPLIGSHRKIKTDNSSHTPPFGHKNMNSPKKQQQQMKFLHRMKKARDIILTYQRRNKIVTNEANKFVQKLNDEQGYTYFTKQKRKSFSQVIYKIQQSQKRLPKNESQRGKDKSLRECKSQFMPNLKQKHKKNLHILLNRNGQTERNQNQNFSYKQNPQSEEDATQRPKNKIQSSQKYLLKALFNQQIIRSSGSELVQKLKKCLSAKQKNQENAETNIQNENNIKQNEEIQKNQKQGQQSSKQQQPSQSRLQFPYRDSKMQVKSHKFLQKQKKKIKISIKKLQQPQDEDILYQQQQKDIQKQNKIKIKLYIQNQRQSKIKKSFQKSKNISKSLFIDQNYKISGWDQKQTYQPLLQ